MTQEQYKRAELITREIDNLKYALNAMESKEDISLTINWFKNIADTLPAKVVVCDVGLNETIRDYLNKRIAELEKKFEEL